MKNFWKGFEKQAMVPLGAFASGASKLTNVAQKGLSMATKHPLATAGGALGAGVLAGRASAPVQQRQQI